MFFYYFIYLSLMVLIYALVPLLGNHMPFEDGIVKYYAVLNIVFLFTVIWWNARKHFYYVWGAYLLILAGYYGFLYPGSAWLLESAVITVAAVNVAVTLYDVALCRCKGIYKRTGKRYSLPFGN
ncbi:hypothetical protein AGJ34_20275 [Cronobacter dublinensis subsp. dublinensis]|nr:hypothetical protein [Cronobacter dublinensis subsp. dublinensis]EGT5729988.1 hypothetical protein [Cronobacter dublinensis subsp. dublinensis]